MSYEYQLFNHAQFRQLSFKLDGHIQAAILNMNTTPTSFKPIIHHIVHPRSSIVTWYTLTLALSHGSP